MYKIKIGIDLDITLFDTDKGWYNFLLNNCTYHNLASYRSDVLGGCVAYDLRKYFTLKDGVDGFSYWSDKNTYAKCDVHRFAKQVIQNLYEANCEIIFISYCMGCPDQIKYKMKRLREEFDFLLPDDFNFIPTKKKGLVKCDILIDDRHEFINQMDKGVKIIKYASPYVQSEPLDKEVSVCNNWNDVEDLICNYLENN
ncbi:hypothetical protein VPHG_00194 [Vibrio phage 11895-B1]|uniref:hypothetical protein n=1 Tax=Vibrio phage 11895-B1 TaxID=754075 RepID=UPI0002C11E24|nr:hypothetical protein VPHG_00194 [Vibrio phage 11895-B1]AGH32257.1 hypothetical protein VPHG_00194 [Vibrio phage 11895-B1]